MTIRRRKPGTLEIAAEWSNRKAARVAAMAAQGRSSIQIAEALHDGTSPATVRAMLLKWRVQTTGTPFCQVPLSITTRAWLGWRAERRGLTPEEYLRQVVDKVIRENLFDAIVGE